MNDREASSGRASIAGLTRRVSFFELDVTCEERWIAITDAVVAEFGRINVLAREGYNIRCNSVHPPFVETPMLRAMIALARDPQKMEANYANAAPLGRLAQPIEVARAILFLASDESSFTTEAELVVDGGLTAA